ncbi:AfsR/SARP family transcriptional regulator [Nonomuraea sp. NN258]|uniref:BTAD domain-containing putative transcriptional regulator n=1 Tax=Nonomuraea antri TaxID=2730852 RepID=UPI00156902FE|nr:BTAD domain-containing putative transcriptional regulator [Nonomuraea antri]NRQ35834.1 AfsR/SARP family transcriptional regulator [Nonomuraea antri]
MRFGVLGPLTVWTSDGRPVRIPEVKVRALLAELVIGAGRVVPADRLIDDLWGESLPANPANALQTRVSQLRRALEDAEPGARELVVSRQPGYLLDVRADAVDVGRFQSLLTQARTAGTPQARATLLGDALALWRGPALIDFADEEWARPEVTRLAELRLTAVEEQAEARLELGEHVLLADELGDLVARHPLRERLRAAHLRALYRAGRQSEALDGYRDLRTRLADELGVDPGPELTALHQSILRQDPSLGVAPAAPPSNLPAPLTDLIGRSEAVEQVIALVGGHRLVTLTGPGGVGKTQLALAAARRLTSGAAADGASTDGGFDDGVTLVELGSLPGGASRCEVAELVAATLNIRDEAATAIEDHLAESLRSRRLLLVLDNCEHVVSPVAELVSLLLRTAPGLRVLATGQRPLEVTGERLWNVPPLAEPGAVRLFVTRAAAGAPGFALDESNADVITAICRRLDGLPLALELAATRVRTLGVHELAARLGALDHDPFRVLGAGASDAPARQRTLRAMIDWSWELLTEAERVVLRRLAVHADGCTLAAAEGVCADDQPVTGTAGGTAGVVVGADVLDLVAGLVDRSLVSVSAREDSEGPRYRLLESVAAYCRQRLREAGELAEIEARHRRYYVELAVAADRGLRGPAQRQWLRRLDAETANLRAALETAVRDAPGQALRLVNSLAWYWVLRGRLGEGLRSLSLALSANASTDVSTGTAQQPTPTVIVAEAADTARIWHAAFTFRTGDLPDPAAPVPGERPRELEALTGRMRAEWFRALVHLGAVEEQPTGDLLAVFRAIGDQWGAAAALAAGARQAMMRSDLATMAEYGTQSMALFSELGDRWGQLHAAYALGTHAEIVGDYEQAARLHRESLRMAEDLGLGSDVSDKLSALGRIALLTGDYALSDDLHERARKLAEEQGYLVGAEFAELGLALSARRQGRLDDAERHLRNWLDWDKKIGSDIALALILAELGFIAEQRGDAETARDVHREGLAAARGSGDRRAVALAFEGLAGAEAAAGRHVEAARLLGAAAALRESVGAPLPPAERGDVNRIGDAARRALGDESFATEFAHGHATPPEPIT